LESEIHIHKGAALLLTDKNHRMPSFPFLTSSTQEMWRAMTFDLAIPYTFISYANEHGGVWISQCSVFWRQQDVLKICRDAEIDSRIKILDVWLLLPCGIDSRQSWRWVTVSEILSGEVKHSPTAWPYYVTTEGEFIEGGRSDGTSKQMKLTKVFQKPNA
jgi:hypothetical protein